MFKVNHKDTRTMQIIFIVARQKVVYAKDGRPRGITG